MNPTKNSNYKVKYKHIQTIIIEIKSNKIIFNIYRLITNRPSEMSDEETFIISNFSVSLQLGSSWKRQSEVTAPNPMNFSSKVDRTWFW